MQNLSTKVLHSLLMRKLLSLKQLTILGGATVAFSYQQTENDGGTTGKDGDAYSITYKQSF